jgi:putative transposase
MNGIYHCLKTCTQWQWLPICFGSYSAIHRLFQELAQRGFFELFWKKELQEAQARGLLDLSIQALDASHIKAPLGQELTGKSPVDRAKLGSKRSVVSDKNGIPIGFALGSGNQHDSTLFYETIASIPLELLQPFGKEMHLDAGYDSEEVRTVLFRYEYVPKICKNRRRAAIEPKKITPWRRWVIEPVHSWMNRSRRLLVRFEKRAINYKGFVQFALGLIVFNKLGV